MKNLVIDLDHTLTTSKGEGYASANPNIDTIRTLKEYKNKGFYITIFTSRNMRTHEGNIGKINVHTLPVILEWLEKHAVPFDEVIVGKPWCGHDGFYVDDKAIRPDEFNKFTYEEIRNIIGCV